MTTKNIVSDIADRAAFLHLLQHNPGLIIIKLGAKWCAPCKAIEPLVHGFFLTSPAEVLCADIDVDECFDVYAYLKNKKMVNGIPVLLCYKKKDPRVPKEQISFIPDDSVTGAHAGDLDAFFKRCGKHLEDIKAKCYI